MCEWIIKPRWCQSVDVLHQLLCQKCGNRLSLLNDVASLINLIWFTLFLILSALPSQPCGTWRGTTHFKIPLCSLCRGSMLTAESVAIGQNMSSSHDLFLQTWCFVSSSYVSTYIPWPYLLPFEIQQPNKYEALAINFQHLCCCALQSYIKQKKK